MGRHQLGESAGGLFGVARVDAGGQAALREAPAQAEVARLACRAERVDAARAARQPRVENDALPAVDASGVRAHLLDGRNQLVAEDFGELASRLDA